MIKAMMTVSMCRLILLILPFWSIGSNGNRVKIIETGLRADNESYECGERIMLTCIITEFSQFMTWQNDSSNTPLAQCTLGHCLFDNKSAGIFKFTYNTSLAVFNLTILKTTFVNNGSTYSCKDVGTGDNSSSTIKVSDYLPIMLEEKGDNLTVTSGCIDPSVKVDIVWYKVKPDTGEESKYIPTTTVMPVKQVACSTDNICGLSSYMQMTTTIVISQDGNNAYKVKAVLFYNGERKESNTTETVYMIKDKSKRETENKDSKLQALHVVGKCIGIIALVIVPVIVNYYWKHTLPAIVYYCWKHTQCEKVFQFMRDITSQTERNDQPDEQVAFNLDLHLKVIKQTGEISIQGNNRIFQSMTDCLSGLTMRIDQYTAPTYSSVQHLLQYIEALENCKIAGISHARTAVVVTINCFTWESVDVSLKMFNGNEFKREIRELRKCLEMSEYLNVNGVTACCLSERLHKTRQSLPTQAQLKDFTCEKHKLECTWYCFNHDTFFCPTCKDVDHGKLEQVISDRSSNEQTQS